MNGAFPFYEWRNRTQLSLKRDSCYVLLQPTFSGNAGLYWYFTIYLLCEEMLFFNCHSGMIQRAKK